MTLVCLLGLNILLSAQNSGVVNGHKWVDLGLPSGIKWAACNVGAISPEEYGDYFAWGEISSKNKYVMKNSLTYGEQIGNIEGNNVYDVATAKWGRGWRMPTEVEMQELIDNCTWIWITMNDVNGYIVTGSNGNSIFMPAAGSRYDSLLNYAGSSGLYWSSTYSDFRYCDEYSNALYMVSSKPYMNVCARNLGLSVRPVIKF